MRSIARGRTSNEFQVSGACEACCRPLTQSAITTRNLHFLRALVHSDRLRGRLALGAKQLEFMRRRPGIPFCTRFDYLAGAVEMEVLAAEGHVLPDELMRMARTGHGVDVVVFCCAVTGSVLELRSPFYSGVRWLRGLEAILLDLPDDMSRWDMLDVHSRLRERLPQL